jgi:hypothetical protein
VERYQGKPFALLGVNIDNDPSKVLHLQQEGQLTWRSFCGGALDIAAAYGVHAIPEVVVIDHKGVIRSVSVGAPNTKELDKELDDLVTEAELGK